MRVIRNLIHALCLAVLFLFICSLLGCASFQGSRFYSGPPLQKNEIALVWGINTCRIDFLNDGKANEDKLLHWHMNSSAIYSPRILELLPGHYNAGITYQRQPRVQSRVNIQAGNIYIIYPEITSSSQFRIMTWQPIIVNVNDYNKEDCERAMNGFKAPLDCPDRDKIREWTMEYLQNKRPSMSYHLLDDPRIEEIEGERHFYNGYWQ
jgi:hypothetical protein